MFTSEFHASEQTVGVKIDPEPLKKWNDERS